MSANHLQLTTVIFMYANVRLVITQPFGIRGDIRTQLKNKICDGMLNEPQAFLGSTRLKLVRSGKAGDHLVEAIGPFLHLGNARIILQ